MVVFGLLKRIRKVSNIINLNIKIEALLSIVNERTTLENVFYAGVVRF